MVLEDTRQDAQHIKSQVAMISVDQLDSEEEAKNSMQEVAEQVSQRRLDALEVLARTVVGDNLDSDQLDEEVLMLKEMLVDVVDQIMENEINELDDDTIEAIMEHYIPVLNEQIKGS